MQTGRPKQLGWEELLRSLPGYDPFRDAAGYRFDATLAQFHIDFVQQCCTFTHGPKAGQPFVLEPFQRAVLANIHGWRRADGARRFRTVLFYVPRGNGKSEFAATQVCDALFIERAPGAQIISAAAKRDQTHYVFDPVRRMIANCAEMKSRSETFKNAIVAADRSYKTISREATTEHGGTTYLGIVDELHAQPDRELVDVIVTSATKHPESLVWFITTADCEREGSICNEKYDYACKVRDGVVADPEFLPVIYEAAKEDDWLDPATWAKANPNFGVSLRKEDFDKIFREAKESPAMENTVRRLHLNQRTEAVSRWLTSEDWDACLDEDLSLGDFAGQPCWAGLDLSSISDFTACVLAFRIPLEFAVVSGEIVGSGPAVAVFPLFWAPRETAKKREQKRRIPYAAWERRGALALTEGNEVDYDAVRRGLNRVVAEHRLNVREIAADRLYQGLDICRRLKEDDGYTVIEHGQGFLGMAVPARETERLVIGHRLRHPNNPVLNWMMANAVVTIDAAGNRKPNREKSTDKIDGVVAMVMAVGRALADVEPEAPSFASTGGLRTL